MKMLFCVVQVLSEDAAGELMPIVAGAVFTSDCPPQPIGAV